MREWHDRAVLVAGAHPDDETIGCGGAIAKMVEEGAHVTVLLSIRRVDTRGVRDWTELCGGLRSACEALGATAVIPETLVDEVPPDVAGVHELIEPYIQGVDTVFTHWVGDVNEAHRTMARAVEIGTRPFRRRRDVLLFEIPTSTDQAYSQTFAPNTWMRLEARHAQAATAAMSCYPGEYAFGREPADLLARLELRGRQIGTEYAQAFMNVRRFL